MTHNQLIRGVAARQMREEIRVIEGRVAAKYHMAVPDTQTLSTISLDATNQLRRFILHNVVLVDPYDYSLTAQFDRQSLYLALEPNPPLRSLLEEIQFEA